MDGCCCAVSSLLVIATAAVCLLPIYLQVVSVMVSRHAVPCRCSVRGVFWLVAVAWLIASLLR